MSHLRSFIIVFFVAILVVNCIVTMLTPWNYLWVVDASNDLISILLYAMFCFYLRPYEGMWLLSYEDLRIYSALTVIQGEHAPPWDLERTILIENPTDVISIAYTEEYDKQENRLLGKGGTKK